ncbi:FMRFamide receptor [Elysia marginata]|uniref:FMRFamide receptor n=1 Tax=Elysia marginata TaxID=1093978 RepID=A0AAV4J364_9GAST|nr:FMRFamide receptor [Elysia marginata]
MFLYEVMKFEMDQDLRDALDNETNRTSLPLESVYFTTRPIFSWAMMTIGSLGIIGNILTLFVYSRLGFSTSINISYTALAVSDLFCVLTSMVLGVRFIGIPLPTRNAQARGQIFALLGAYPHTAFSRTTSLLTAWISLERCLCVVFPIKVKIMITRRVTEFAVTTIFLLGCFPLVFLYSGYMTKRQQEPKSNMTSLVLPNSDGPVGKKFDAPALFLFGLVYPIVSSVTVMVCTVALIFKLRQSTRWRRLNATAATRGVPPYHSTSTKELRVTRVVVTITSIFLVCSLPTAAHLLAISSVDGYSGSGHLRYIGWINSMVIVLFAEINSSLNFVIFTASGLRFRQVLLQIMTGWVCRI